MPQIAGAANPNALAPVMVWIYGGGYTLGEKSSPSYNPAGIIKASQVNGSEGVIFVALNYRVRQVHIPLQNPAF